MAAPSEDIYAWLQRRAGLRVVSQTGTSGAGAGAESMRTIREPSTPTHAKLLYEQLETLMFGCGSTRHSNPEAVHVLFSMVSQFLESLVHASLDHAAAAASSREVARAALTRDAAEGYGAQDVIAVLQDFNPSYAGRVERVLRQRQRLAPLLHADISGGAEEASYSHPRIAAPRPHVRTEAEAREARAGAADKARYDVQVSSGSFVHVPGAALSAQQQQLLAAAGRAGGQMPLVRPPMSATQAALAAAAAARAKGKPAGPTPIAAQVQQTVQMLTNQPVTQAESASALQRNPAISRLFPPGTVEHQKVVEEVVIQSRWETVVTQLQAQGQPAASAVAAQLMALLIPKRNILVAFINSKAMQVQAQGQAAAAAPAPGAAGADLAALATAAETNR